MMESPTEGSSSAAEQTRREMRWLLLVFAVMIALGVLCWLAFPHVTPAVKGRLGRRHLADLQRATAEEDWHTAVSALRDARRWAPEDPDIMRAGIDFLTAVNGDPRTIIASIRQLQQSGHAKSADLAQMGRMHVRVSESEQARALYAQIPAQDHALPPVLLLQADLLAVDGRHDEAREIRRSALLADTDSAENLMKLAAIDLTSSDPGRRAAIRQRLWEAARVSDATALPAIEALAGTSDLSIPQAAELLRLVESLDAERAVRARFKVISAQMRLSPQMRSELLQAEVMRWKQRPTAETAPLMQWLAEEREHALILRMTPPQVAARHPGLLPAYAAALRGEQKWQELAQLLKSGKIDSSFPVQKMRLWQAEVRWHLDQQDVSRARQALTLVFEESGRGDELSDALEAASLAEQFHLWDLAQRFYQSLAAKHPHIRAALLPKIYQMAEFQHDADALLQACTDLLALQPDSAPYRIQKLYLQMLIGSEIEIAARDLQDIAATSDARADQLQLVSALSAYRQGRAEDVRAAVSGIVNPDKLPPGQRVVYAALLKLSAGDEGHAFRMVERVSPLLLLPEEKVFLQRAL